MSVLLDSLAAGFQGDAARRSILDEALRDGLPGPRSEAWKYTPLRALERRSFGVAPAQPPLIDPALLDAIPAPRLVFVNGRHAQALSSLDALPAGVSLRPLSAALGDGDEALRFLHRRFDRTDEVFARLNAALAGEGVLLRVEADTAVEVPLQLVFIGAPSDADDSATQDLAWHLRHLIELRQGASLAVVEHHLHVGEGRHLTNALAHVHVADGARLDHARVQDDAAGATLFLRTDVVLAKDAEYRRVDVELGGALSRHELNVRLEGERARLTANGVLLGTGRRHVDTRLGIDHVARDTSAELLWRGAAAGRGRVVFHGGILIREGADGTDAQLSNKNLLLSADAEIDTQPVLVIHADEVQAAHGATVGQLDDDALFYLRARGIPELQARALLTAAFVREPLGAVEGPLRGALEAALARMLDGIVSG
ncbi:Fe-S cluster assembly protein SufD [Luteimonas yindakuii]|uniref:Fe-S cluster assembly protein SufD n=1 Tax=Luteimonas yindakuii TaxID=2565782 RepID=A0A4Z1R1S7_9GAMM|nr:Fe-S cluster assembly protein SufD [Luteimonas yindakuii]TKS53462.1 Fe-S cluster assembly protein SufD [Luteimonas yindakuii]